ncbi:hypothetical protein ERO13_A10G184800v2 [Gossypium hirsutum]|uniref:Factor of DNA methylation 4 isoform X1 n=7 Tax=Gossypium TaxID=3633 RepID=A0A1U8IEV7_GOSHI|nr:factor of DNA methylation 4-like isoform X1 [Gossypium hirsutum]XP_052876732.1 factor of DNA methylation 4-like isoform X1 [Gossypium arboreum]KAG4180755.1 hypothetical protein ERO13_A10G184800v2 [Gossypium hirsutum]TYG99770.1 hypothetical protein ES288_A10G222600v1 [Gossypium darwinii]TYJ15731.1 hypothetical protein E1A91_A10G203600v1 [Gossypium mustelinum]
MERERKSYQEMERLGYPKTIDGNHAFIKACDEDLRKMIDQNHGLIKAHDEEMERIKQMADDMFTMEQESMADCFPHKRRKIDKLLLMSEIINLRHNKMMNEMALLEADERMSILAQEHQTEKDEFERRIKELERKVDDKRVVEVEIESPKEEIKVKPKVEAIEEEE